MVDGPIPDRLPDPPLIEEKKKRDRRGYVSPAQAKRDADRAAKRAEKFESAGANKLPEPVKSKPAFLPQGKRLSATEAKELSTPFAESMTDYFQYLDQYLWTREEKAGKSSGQRPIWSNLDQEEMEALTRVMMRFGQHNAGAAVMVRGIVEGRDYLTAAMIFGPRIALTREIFQETQVPKQPRQRKEKPNKGREYADSAYNPAVPQGRI